MNFTDILAIVLPILLPLMLAIWLAQKATDKEIMKEMKDFHGRLCTIEEKHNKNIEIIVTQCMEARK